MIGFGQRPAAGIFLAVMLGVVLGAGEGRAQAPGFIYQPSSGGLAQQVMDPNGDGFISKSRLGFPVGKDGAAEMELPMVRVPYFVADPQGDLATGGSGSQLDIIGSPDDGGSVYVLRQTVGGLDYLMVRIRLASNSSAGKAWGLLIDTDGQIQFSGRNPGYEKEVLLVTGSGGGVQVNTLTRVRRPWWRARG